MIRIERLTKQESSVVGEALRAAADGPFFPDWEFYALFGVGRNEFRAIASQWPLPIAPPEIVAQCVGNSMHWLRGFPHGKMELWSEWISIGPKAFRELEDRLRKR